MTTDERDEVLKMDWLTLPAVTNTVAAQLITVYGQVAAGQSPTPGSYSDTITATVNY